MILGSKISSYCSHFMLKETEAQPPALKLLRDGALLPHHSMLLLLSLSKTGLGPQVDRCQDLLSTTYQFDRHCH